MLLSPAVIVNVSGVSPLSFTAFTSAAHRDQEASQPEAGPSMFSLPLRQCSLALASVGVSWMQHELHLHGTNSMGV